MKTAFVKKTNIQTRELSMGENQAIFEWRMENSWSDQFTSIHSIGLRVTQFTFHRLRKSRVGVKRTDLKIYWETSETKINLYHNDKAENDPKHMSVLVMEGEGIEMACLGATGIESLIIISVTYNCSSRMNLV